jgi:GxxExxY protein
MRVPEAEYDRVQSIVGAFYAVYNYYGYGLLESVYCGALEHELTDRGHRVAREVSFDVTYKGRHVARQRVDMLVDDWVIVEVKATEHLPPYAKRQLVNYLRATSASIGVLFHFGPEAYFWRATEGPKSDARPSTLDPKERTLPSAGSASSATGDAGRSPARDAHRAT